MTYRFMTPALRELDSAAAYYENRREGLGLQFIAVNRKLLARILENPRQFPAISGRLRKAGMRRFLFDYLPSGAAPYSCCGNSTRSSASGLLEKQIKIDAAPAARVPEFW